MANYFTITRFQQVIGAIVLTMVIVMVLVQMGQLGKKLTFALMETQ
jgi:hypothetical protein